MDAPTDTVAPVLSFFDSLSGLFDKTNTALALEAEKEKKDIQKEIQGALTQMIDVWKVTNRPDGRF